MFSQNYYCNGEGGGENEEGKVMRVHENPHQVSLFCLSIFVSAVGPSLDTYPFSPGILGFAAVHSILDILARLIP